MRLDAGIERRPVVRSKSRSDADREIAATPPDDPILEDNCRYQTNALMDKVAVRKWRAER